jgi:ATP-dependent Lhr-like helicase
VVRQAVLTSPMFAARWRWNLNRSLAVLRMRGGKKNPPAIQRMEADDLMAAVFPTLAACQENVAPGPLEIPDHPLVRQTLEDCLREAMDIDGLKRLLAGIETGEVTVVVRDTTEPSVLAHEILNGRPFTYLDDAPLEERRSRAVPLPRGLPVQARELGRLDPAAIQQVSEQVRPDPRDPDELHDLLMTVVAHRPVGPWQEWFGTLVQHRRAVTVLTPAGKMWCAAERRRVAEALFPGAPVVPDHPSPLPAGALVPAEEADQDIAAAQMLRGYLEGRGPATAADLAETSGLPQDLVLRALARLEAEGFALRGHFTTPGGAASSSTPGHFTTAGAAATAARSSTPGHFTTPGGAASSTPGGEEEFCARRLLARIHAYTRQRQRREIEPVTARDFMRFLLRWQHVAPGTRREGAFGVLAVIEQLQGFELAAGAWERPVIASRVDGYRREWLDEACLSGQITWGRLSVRDGAPDPAPRRSGLTPSRATPITLTLREDLPWLIRAARGDLQPAEPGPGRTSDILDALRQHGAVFHSDLTARTGRLPTEVDEALWDGVARGLVTADGFRAVRSLLRRPSRPRRPQPRGLRRGLDRSGAGPPGRWTLLPSPLPPGDPDDLAEAVAEQLIARWGVVFHDLFRRESLVLPWREILWALRRMEARGTIRGGRFVAGFSGEQFAHPNAVDVFRAIRKQPRTGETVQISAADPLNLTGIVLPGPRIPATHANSVTYIDGALPNGLGRPA